VPLRSTEVYLVAQRDRLLLWLLAEVEILALQLLLQINLVHQISQAMNLYLLDLICVLCDLLVLVHILKLQLSLHIKLEGLHKVLICVLWRSPLVGVMHGLFLLLQQPALVLAQLVLNLVLNVVEIQRRNSWIGILRN
jgi:hypothetical protein